MKILFSLVINILDISFYEATYFYNMYMYMCYDVAGYARPCGSQYLPGHTSESTDWLPVQLGHSVSIMMEYLNVLLSIFILNSKSE